MQDTLAKRNGSLRLTLAALAVLSGLLVISPSFEFDTDRDGVADSTEVYERGTDPAKPDAKYRLGVAGKADKG